MLLPNLNIPISSLRCRGNYTITRIVVIQREASPTVDMDPDRSLASLILTAAWYGPPAMVTSSHRATVFHIDTRLCVRVALERRVQAHPWQPRTPVIVPRLRCSEPAATVVVRDKTCY